jgi:hypothetical protein
MTTDEIERYLAALREFLPPDAREFDDDLLPFVEHVQTHLEGGPTRSQTSRAASRRIDRLRSSAGAKRRRAMPPSCSASSSPGMPPESNGGHSPTIDRRLVSSASSPSSC